MNVIKVVPAPRQAESNIYVLAAELYEDGVTVDLLGYDTAIEEISDEEAARRGFGVHLSDDLGTEYVNVGGGGGGQDRIERLALDFTPAVPREARSLRVTTQAGTVSLEL